MRTSIFLLLVLPLVASFVVACSGDDDSATPVASPSATIAVTANVEPTATPEGSATQEPGAGVPTPTVTVMEPVPSPSPAVAGGEIGQASVEAGYQDLIKSMYTNCQNVTDVECLNGVVENANLAPEVMVFWQDYQAFLVDFEEHGTVDYGAVSSPTANMARPEPVFLNGNFGLKYLSELLPTDWKSADPTYASLGDVIAWAEYATLTEASSTGSQQTFTIAVPIRQCRACADLGNLNLEVTFDAGDLQGVKVLPKTDVSPTPSP